MIIKEEVGLTLDDLQLIPRKSYISSRFNGEIDMSSKLLPGLILQIPLISSNMNTVTERDMMVAMRSLGALGIVHRFMSIEAQYDQLKNSTDFVVGCIGITDEAKKRADRINDVCHGWLLDVAHGHSDMMLKMIEWIKQFKKPIIAGNVATFHGAIELVDAGADSIKVGVGNGSLCSTRLQTGNGVPLATSIIDAYNGINTWYESHQDRFKPTIICDGGIRYSGDIVKVLALGADAIMSGRLFAGTNETPCDSISIDNQKLMPYAGMASKLIQEGWKGQATSIEGESTFVPYVGSVIPIVEYLKNGILSGFAYQNAKNVQELRDRAEFIKITASGIREAQPSAKVR